MPQQKQRLLLGLLLAILILLLLGIAWPFVSALVLASMFAVMMHPVNRRLTDRLRRPGLASLITTLATVMVLGTTLAFVCVTAVQATRSAYKALSRHAPKEGGGPEVGKHTTDEVVDALAARLPVDRETIRTKLLAGVEVGARYLFGKTQGAIQSITSVLVTNVFAMFFLYYLLRYGEGWLRRAVDLVPLSPDVTANLLRAAHQSIVANVNGCL
jgi:predicted PurR-regulated permease PerM